MEIKSIYIVIAISSLVLFIVLSMFIILYNYYTRKKRNCILDKKALQNKIDTWNKIL